MRSIHLAHLDKVRPVVVLTREHMRAVMTNVTVAPITKTVEGLAVEVPVDARNGINETAAISCDNIATIPTAALGRWVGFLLDDQEEALSAAIWHAFDLR